MLTPIICKKKKKQTKKNKKVYIQNKQLLLVSDHFLKMVNYTLTSMSNL